MAAKPVSMCVPTTKEGVWDSGESGESSESSESENALCVCVVDVGCCLR
jgi:hypothetical protein